MLLFLGTVFRCSLSDLYEETLEFMEIYCAITAILLQHKNKSSIIELDVIQGTCFVLMPVNWYIRKLNYLSNFYYSFYLPMMSQFFYKTIFLQLPQTFSQVC